MRRVVLYEVPGQLDIVEEGYSLAPVRQLEAEVEEGQEEEQSVDHHSSFVLVSPSSLS